MEYHMELINVAKERIIPQPRLGQKHLYRKVNAYTSEF